MPRDPVVCQEARNLKAIDGGPGIWQNRGMATPNRPSTESDREQEIIAVLDERDATFDKEPREPWAKVKADLLKTLDQR